MPPKDKYTDPELREEVKEEVQAGDKGGAPGQWSARKAQLVASEYKKRGGGYTTDKPTESQKHLTQWGKEEWQTKEGSGNAKQEDGTEKRYLPKKAWEQMTEEEKEATEEKKLKGSKEGKQYVENTSRAKKARKIASKEAEADGDDGEDSNELENEESHGEESSNAGYDSEGDDSGVGSDEDQNERENSQKEEHRGQKRSHSTKSKASSESENKKQKISTAKSSDKTEEDISDSKDDHDELPAPAGSASRMPQKGQNVHWRFLGRFVSGKVVEVSYEEKEVHGKKVKASKSSPRVVVESENGKFAVHKPEACFFEDE